MIAGAVPRDPDSRSPGDQLFPNGTPCAMAPYYSMLRANEPVCLYDGDLRLTAGSHFSTSVAGTINLRWLPHPEVRFSLPGPPQLGLHAMFGGNSQSLTLGACGANVSAVVTSAHPSVEGVVTDELQVGEERPVRYLHFHLLNFTRVQGSPVFCTATRSHVMGRVNCEDDQWRLILDPVPNIANVIDEVRERGGYVITHIGRLERADGSVFPAAESEDLLNAIYNLFSFCMGRWTAPVLTLEFDDGGTLSREAWGVRTTTSWRFVSSWFSGRRAEMLPALFPGFMRKWRDPLWKDSLRRAIWWYISGNLQSGGVDGGIILAQVALELLAWVTFVENGHIVSRAGFEDLPAADKLRLLLDKMRVPLNVPNALTSLAAYGRSNVPYAPYKFVEIRNALVHPKKRMDVDDAADAVIDAWKLGLWYTELAILFACEYSGQYVDRNVAQWAGQTEHVPWNSNQT